MTTDDEPSKPESRESLHVILARMEQKFNSLKGTAERCFDQLMEEHQARLALEQDQKELAQRLSDIERECLVGRMEQLERAVGDQ